jgi:hypothetical protein
MHTQQNRHYKYCLTNKLEDLPTHSTHTNFQGIQSQTLYKKSCVIFLNGALNRGGQLNTLDTSIKMKQIPLPTIQDGNWTLWMWQQRQTFVCARIQN